MPRGLPWWLSNQKSTCNADVDSVPGWGRSPRRGNGNPLQYSCLGNPMDRGTWWGTVRRVTESDTTWQLQNTQSGPKRPCRDSEQVGQVWEARARTRGEEVWADKPFKGAESRALCDNMKALMRNTNSKPDRSSGESTPPAKWIGFWSVSRSLGAGDVSTLTDCFDQKNQAFRKGEVKLPHELPRSATPQTLLKRWEETPIERPWRASTSKCAA